MYLKLLQDHGHVGKHGDVLAVPDQLDAASAASLIAQGVAEETEAPAPVQDDAPPEAA